MRMDNFCKRGLSLRKFSTQILWLLLLTPALGYAANLVNNPSMEGSFISQPPLGNVAQYWTAWTEAVPPASIAGGFWQGNDAHDASKSQEIQWSGSGTEDFGDDGIYQQINSLQSGQIYRVSVWFKFSFNAYLNWGWSDGSIICRVGVDPNGGTDPNVVTSWADDYDSADSDLYEGSWFNVVLFSPANATTATVFIEAYGSGDAWNEGGGEGVAAGEVPAAGESPAAWEAYCYIDDVNFQLIQISSDNSTVTATTPVPANGASDSKVTITVLDSNSNPIEGIPASQISLNCTGSGNIIFGPETPTDVNGQTTARIVSTTAEIKTVSAAVLGTVLSDTPIVQFCKSDSLSKLRASDGAAYDGFGSSVSISGNYAVVGTPYDDDDGSYSGSAYIFTPNSVDPDNWEQLAKLTASDAAADDRFGQSVSISGSYAIVGAHGDNSYSGSAYIFTPNSVNPDNWEQLAKLTAFDGAAYDHFGQSVSISGSYAIVGAYADNSYFGSAYIFTPNEVDPNNWNQQVVKLTASDGDAYDEFGYSVSISGDYAVVGAPYDDPNGSYSGSAYIFRRNGQNYWSQQAKLIASDGTAEDWFGQSVSISGDYAVIGARSNEGNGSYSGSAYIFHFNGSNWVQQQKLTASDAAGWDDFGSSVSIDGDCAVVGAYGDDSNRGSAYIFRRNPVSGSWIERAKLTAPDGAAGDYFGDFVSINGNYTIVGARGDDDSGSGSGAAYVFNLSALPGDFDADGDVDMVDFSILAGQWLQLPSQPSADAAPCGGDCVVDIWDLAVLCENWLQGTE